MFYFVHCDVSFKNTEYMRKKLKVLSSEPDLDDTKQQFNTINILYGTTNNKIRKATNDFNITLLNRNNTNEGISEAVQFSDAIILFHNFIEYNNGMNSIIEESLKYNIPIFIFSGHCSGLLTNNNHELKIIKSFDKHITLIKSRNKDQIINITDYFKPTKLRKTIEEVTETVRESYSLINETKENSKIILIN